MIEELLKKAKEFGWRKIIMRVIIAFIVLGATFGACSRINQYLGVSDDNPIEEIIEAQIENQTGLDIDLSPESAEK